MNTALTIIYLIIGVIILTFLGYLIATNTPDCSNAKQQPVASSDSEIMIYVSDNPSTAKGGGDDCGCGCDGAKKVGGDSYAGRILKDVIPVTSVGGLEKMISGGATKDNGYAFIGGKWNNVSNMKAYQGMITGGGSVRFSDKHIEPISGGAVGRVLDATHPVQLSHEEFMTAIPGGAYADKKYFSVKTSGGKNQWFERI